MIELSLPWPPSANKYYRHPGNGRHLISREGRNYRQLVGYLVNVAEPLAGRLDVRIYAAPPDRRRRDLDNTAKACQDALTHAGAWRDDEQIDRLYIERMPAAKPGMLQVEIREISA